MVGFTISNRDAKMCTMVRKQNDKSISYKYFLKSNIIINCTTEEMLSPNCVENAAKYVSNSNTVCKVSNFEQFVPLNTISSRSKSI
jgi:hypothetical protein